MERESRGEIEDGDEESDGEDDEQSAGERTDGRNFVQEDDTE